MNSKSAESANIQAQNAQQSNEQEKYRKFYAVLEEELLPAMGCTEPIAVAYAAALARDTLGTMPERAEISVSGNILKNVKSVVVPNTDGLRGISAAAAAGIAAGKAERKLEALAGVTPEDIIKIKRVLSDCRFTVSKSRSGCVFDIGVRLFSGAEQSFVRIEGRHTNVTVIEKNGKSAQKIGKEHGESGEETFSDRSFLTVESIYEFANAARADLLEPLTGRQIRDNMRIAEEGLKNEYGACVGKVLLNSFGNGLHNRARAVAAAGSDARMNGCGLPVVIVSGSGNQGMAASLPVAVYAKELGASYEKTLRAVALSDLITVHLKTGIGRLSAYCGAVSAGCGAGAGVCYLTGGTAKDISETLSNALAINSGIICDGAKSSCAAKISSAVDAGLLGMEMSRRGKKFLSGDGILGCNVESTIENVGEIARVGMKETDEEIIRLMIRSCN